jgi:hypothetical protein
MPDQRVCRSLIAAAGTLILSLGEGIEGADIRKGKTVTYRGRQRDESTPRSWRPCSTPLFLTLSLPGPKSSLCSQPGCTS